MTGTHRGGGSPDRRPLQRSAGVLVLVMLAAALVWLWSERSSDSDAVAGVTPEPTASVSARESPVVLAISVDGLNPAALDLLGETETPNFHRLIEEGAATLNARTAYELTVTLPNHAGMLTGRGIQGTAGHQLEVNTDPGNTLADVHGSYVPGMFDVAHDHGLATALFAQKAKFELFTRSWDESNGAADTEAADDGTDKIDVELVGDDAPAVEAVNSSLARDQADLLFLHLQAPDAAGHDHGWLSAEYLEAVRDVDADLGRILETVDDTDGLAERLTIVLTSDHGGPEGATRHNEMDRYENYRVAFVAWGRGVDRGADLYALNPNRRDPGTDRPDYAGPQPIRNIDVSATALNLLGLSPLSHTTSARWPDLLLR